MLGLILYNFPEFSFMDTVDARVRLQKFIYLLQVFGIHLGYDYSWYLRGPHCSSLATDGLLLSDIYDDIDNDIYDDIDNDIYDDMVEESDADMMVFADNSMQERFERFVRFVSGRGTNTAFLEVAASLHYQLTVNPDVGIDEAVRVVVYNMPDCDETYVYGMFSVLKKEGLVR